LIALLCASSLVAGDEESPIVITFLTAVPSSQHNFKSKFLFHCQRGDIHIRHSGHCAKLPRPTSLGRFLIVSKLNWSVPVTSLLVNAGDGVD
jgi:hypothetical protein